MGRFDEMESEEGVETVRKTWPHTFTKDGYIDTIYGQRGQKSMGRNGFWGVVNGKGLVKYVVVVLREWDKCCCLWENKMKWVRLEAWSAARKIENWFEVVWNFRKGLDIIESRSGFVYWGKTSKKTVDGFYCSENKIRNEEFYSSRKWGVVYPLWV